MIAYDWQHAKRNASGFVLSYHLKYTGSLIDARGATRWFIDGVYGREDDLPCVIYANGDKHWYIENPKRGGFGQRPAVEHRGGGLPAVVRANGDELYFEFGVLHRDGGLPAVVLASGAKKWFERGKCVRFEMGSLGQVALEVGDV